MVGSNPSCPTDAEQIRHLRAHLRASRLRLRESDQQSQNPLESEWWQAGELPIRGAGRGPGAAVRCDTAGDPLSRVADTACGDHGLAAQGGRVLGHGVARRGLHLLGQVRTSNRGGAA